MVARDTIFTTLMKSVDQWTTNGCHSRNDGQSTSDQSRPIVVPWIPIKRRSPNLAADDICELYMFHIDDDKDFPTKMLKRQTIRANMVESEPQYDPISDDLGVIYEHDEDRKESEITPDPKRCDTVEAQIDQQLHERTVFCKVKNGTPVPFLDGSDSPPILEPVATQRDVDPMCPESPMGLNSPSSLGTCTDPEPQPNNNNIVPSPITNSSFMLSPIPDPASDMLGTLTPEAMSEVERSRVSNLSLEADTSTPDTLPPTSTSLVHVITSPKPGNSISGDNLCVSMAQYSATVPAIAEPYIQGALPSTMITALNAPTRTNSPPVSPIPDIILAPNNPLHIRQVTSPEPDKIIAEHNAGDSTVRNDNCAIDQTSANTLESIWEISPQVAPSVASIVEHPVHAPQTTNTGMQITLDAHKSTVPGTKQHDNDHPATSYLDQSKVLSYQCPVTRSPRGKTTVHSQPGPQVERSYRDLGLFHHPPEDSKPRQDSIPVVPIQTCNLRHLIDKASITTADMATQTGPKEIPDLPIRQSEFTSQMDYVESTLTNHKRRMRANEVWREKQDRKVDKSDADFYTLYIDLRADHEKLLASHDSLTEGFLSLQKVVEDLIMISPNYENMITNVSPILTRAELSKPTQAHPQPVTRGRDTDPG